MQFREIIIDLPFNYVVYLLFDETGWTAAGDRSVTVNVRLTYDTGTSRVTLVRRRRHLRGHYRVVVLPMLIGARVECRLRSRAQLNCVARCIGTRNCFADEIVRGRAQIIGPQVTDFVCQKH